jgi:hypothetical protein
MLSHPVELFLTKESLELLRMVHQNSKALFLRHRKT